MVYVVQFWPGEEKPSSGYARYEADTADDVATLVRDKLKMGLKVCQINEV